MPERTPQQRGWFADNEANWDDRADFHMAGGYGGVEDVVADPAAISEQLAQDIHHFGDLGGRDVIHLQCHVGTDTLGFSRLGARRVVGVDLSENSLAHARRLAGAAGVDIEYVHSNVYDAREAVEGHFDLVHTSLGVLCWLPDIAGWARVVASLLAPGGTFFIRDDHPMFMTVADPREDLPGVLSIEYPYFEVEEPSTWEDDGSYVEAPDAPRIRHTRNHQWNHSLGEILTSLIQAGLVIDSVEETPYSAWCPWPELMVQEEGRWRLRDDPARLPLQFAIKAHRAAEADTGTTPVPTA